MIRRMLDTLLPARNPAPEPQPAKTIDHAALASAAGGLKLNLGCGFDLRDGWLNIDLNDFHSPDLVCDVTWLRTLDDHCAGYVLAQDILEHIHRDRCRTALHEWNRVLMMGGLLEVRVPNVIALADLMRQPERADPQGHAVLLQCMFGTQGYSGDFHLNGFTEISIRNNFAEAGFEMVSLRPRDEWLFEALGKKTDHRPPDAALRQDSDGDFLEQAYRDHLGRVADAEGKAFWMLRLADGAPREVVLSVIKKGV